MIQLAPDETLQDPRHSACDLVSASGAYHLDRCIVKMTTLPQLGN